MQHHGIHLAITAENVEKDGDSHWFIDLENGAFWPEEYPAAHRATVMCSYPRANSSRDVIFGCRDGYLRQSDDAAEDDDGEAIEAYCVLGPIRLDEANEAMVVNAQAVLGEGSADVGWALRAGGGAESAVKSSPVRRGVWRAGRSPINDVRARAAAATIDVSGAGRWTVEQIVLALESYSRRWAV